ncbi:MAG TPA: cupin domain-containing protein [Roseiarcus sp.]|nr:cupin domain-containing protein [Roseiarcus sp.]
MQGAIFEWKDIEPTTVLPGLHARFLHSGAMSFVHWTMEAGAPFPRHAHPHEQVVHLFEGELEVTVEGVTTVLKPGMVAVIPPDAIHHGRALTECRLLDVFHPRREDYMRSDAPNILQSAARVTG